jgi:aminoglycoside 6'-N-acetyltransferase
MLPRPFDLTPLSFTLVRVPFTQIETTRLLVRRFQDGDLSAFLEYRNDPEVARYQGWDSILEVNAQAMITELKHAEPGAPGHWFQFAIALKETAQLVGDCGLCVLVQDARQAQLGISLARAYQGQGFATEAVSAVLDYAFINLDLHRVVATVDAENARSAALMERVGLRREGHFMKNAWFKERWADEYLYAVLQAEWLPRRGLPAGLPQRAAG